MQRAASGMRERCAWLRAALSRPLLRAEVGQGHLIGVRRRGHRLTRCARSTSPLAGRRKGRRSQFSFAFTSPMPRAIRSSATLPLTVSVRIFSAAADGGVGGGGAHVGDRLRLGLRDLGLGHLGAARDELFHLGLGFRGDPLGLGLGALDDARRPRSRPGAACPDIRRAASAPLPSAGAPRRARPARAWRGRRAR